MSFEIRDINAGGCNISWRVPQAGLPSKTLLGSAGPFKPWQAWETHLRKESYASWTPGSKVRLEVLNPFWHHFSQNESFRVLELGCGAYPIIPAFKDSFPWARLFTLEGGAVERTSYYVKVDWRNIPHTRAEIENLPFAESSFKAVIGIFSFCYARRELAGPELARVLTPGGRAALEMMHPESGWLKQFEFYHLLLDYLKLRRENIPATPDGNGRIRDYLGSYGQSMTDYRRLDESGLFTRVFPLKDSCDAASLDQGISDLQKVIGLEYDRGNLFKDKTEIQAFVDVCHLKVVSISSYKEDRGKYLNVSWTVVLDK